MQVQDMLCNPSSPNKSLNELSSSNCSVSVSPSQHHHQHQHHSASHQHHHQQLNHHISNQHIHAHTQHSPITDDQPLSLPDAHARTHTPAHPDQQWSGRASSPHGSLSNSARQSPPCFPRRRQLSAASLTPAHTPILTPANPSASFTATTSSSTSSSQNSDTPSTSAYSSGSSSRNHSHSPPAVMSSMPQVGHAPVSAALQAQALEAMYERPSSSSPPPGSGGAATAAGNGMNNGNGISSRRAGASHRRKSQHGPMRAPIRPYTPSGPTPPRRGGAPPQPTGAAAAPGAYNQPTRAFILERLHEYVPLALSNPRTADVRIVVPSRPPQAQSSRRASEPLTSGSMSASSDARDSTPVTPNGSANGNSNGNGTGGVQAPAAAQAAAQAQAQQSQAEAAQQGPPGSAPPATPHIPVRFYALHRDYLVPQSALFRTILTGGFKDGSPEVKGCKLLPYTSLHGPRPVFVPLPDPESFDALVHWMYFGDVAKLEAQLSSGEVKWRGLIRNIQYLGCDERTRTVVAKWWQRWAQAERNGARANREKDDSEDEADEVDAGRGARRVPLSGGRKQGPGGGPPVDDEDDDDERESSSYDNVDDKLSSPWPSTDNLNYSVDADEMTRKLGGL